MDKMWKVEAVYGQGSAEVYYVHAGTLYEAFQRYYTIYGMKCLTEITITEVRRNERSEGVSGENQMV